MLDASGKLTIEHLRMPAVQFDIGLYVSITRQSADSLSTFSTAGTDRTKLDDEAPVLNINPETFQSLYYAKMKGEEGEPEDHSSSQGSFFPLLREVLTLANETEESKVDIPDVREFITAQTVKNVCRMAEATVSEPKTTFSHNIDGALERVSPLDGA